RIPFSRDAESSERSARRFTFEGMPRQRAGPRAPLRRLRVAAKRGKSWIASRNTWLRTSSLNRFHATDPSRSALLALLALPVLAWGQDHGRLLHRRIPPGRPRRP